jgi:hypothetical protein
MRGRESDKARSWSTTAEPSSDRMVSSPASSIGGSTVISLIRDGSA